MIDINTIIQQALEKAITEAVDKKFDEIELRIEGIEQALRHKSDLGPLRAQFAEDIQQLEYRINNVNDSFNAGQRMLLNFERDMGTVKETLSGMQERFALKDVVNADIEGINRVLDERASVASVECLEEEMNRMQRRLAAAERDSRAPELDSQEVADVIADLFSDGTLTITIDKV